MAEKKVSVRLVAEGGRRVRAELEGVGEATRINSVIETLNAALALLPEWATGEGGVRIGVLDPVELGRIGNPFEGAATAAGAAAADAFSAALSRTYLEPPDLGIGAMAEDGRESNEYKGLNDPSPSVVAFWSKSFGKSTCL